MKPSTYAFYAFVMIFDAFERIEETFLLTQLMIIINVHLYAFLLTHVSPKTEDKKESV